MSNRTTSNSESKKPSTHSSKKDSGNIRSRRFGKHKSKQPRRDTRNDRVGGDGNIILNFRTGYGCDNFVQWTKSMRIKIRTDHGPLALE